MKEHVSVPGHVGAARVPLPEFLHQTPIAEGSGTEGQPYRGPHSLHQSLDVSSRECYGGDTQFPISQTQGIACYLLSFANENNRLIYLAFIREKGLYPDTHWLAHNKEM